MFYSKIKSVRTDFLDEELIWLDKAISVNKGHIEIYDSGKTYQGSKKSDCVKIRYRSRKDALEMLWKIKASRAQHAEVQSGAQKVEKRAYRCPECKGYHLTSKEYWGISSEFGSHSSVDRIKENTLLATGGF